MPCRLVCSLAVFLLAGSALAAGPTDLARRGYRVYPIAKLKLMNTCGHDPNGPFTAPFGSADLITNGSFTAGCKEAVGAYATGGKLRSAGYAKTAARGGVAVLSDGSAVVCRPGSSKWAAIQKQCARGGKQVVEFMGGGALLVWPGATDATADKDLCKVQLFNQGTCGINADQMRSTRHVVVATYGEHVYVALPAQKSGAQIRADLRAAGFSWGVKFDGGHGYYSRLKGGKTDTLAGACNCLGLLVSTR
jgi:hypothetical protein